MPHRPNFTAQLTNKEAVVQAASALGFVQTRGRTSGQGSIREMLENIGAGEVLLLCHNYEYADDMVDDANRLDVFAKLHHPHDNLRELMTALAQALRDAAELK